MNHCRRNITIYPCQYKKVSVVKKRKKMYFKEHLELEPGECTYGIHIELKGCTVFRYVNLKHGTGHRANT